MASNFRTIYLYIVSLITLVMIIGGIVSATNNITSYFYPDSYVFFEEKISSTKYDYDNDYDSDYDNERKNQIKRENYKNERIKNAVVSVVVIVVGGIMYKYHWNIIEKERMR